MSTHYEALQQFPRVYGFNHVYGSLKSQQDWLFTEQYTANIEETISPLIDPSVIDVLFNDDVLRLAELPYPSAAYLALRHIYISLKTPSQKRLPYRSAVYQQDTVSVATGSNSYVVTFDPGSPAPNHFTRLEVGALGVGVTIDSIEVKAANSGTYIPLVYSVTGDTVLVLSDWFGNEGLTNILRNESDTGFDVRFTVTSTGASSFDYLFFGTYDSLAASQYLVQYRDYAGTVHNICVFDETQVAQNIVIDRIIPTPLTDASNINQGQLLFYPKVINTEVTADYNIVVNASIAYLKTGAL